MYLELFQFISRCEAFNNFVSGISYDYLASMLDLMEYYWPFPVVFVAYIVIPNYFVSRIVEKLHKLDSSDYHTSNITKLLGYFERSLFIIFFYYGRFELFIGWFTMKTAINIAYKIKDRGNYRNSYNIFLIGTSLNFIYSFIGFKTLYWGNIFNSSNELVNITKIILAFMSAIGLSSILCLILRNKKCKTNGKSKKDGKSMKGKK